MFFKYGHIKIILDIVWEKIAFTLRMAEINDRDFSSKCLKFFQNKVDVRDSRLFSFRTAFKFHHNTINGNYFSSDREKSEV